MNILELSQTRFSARKYTDEPVSDDDLAYILECARLAPSAVNRQPWKFVVVRSKEAKEQLWQAYDRDWFRTAPLYIVCMKNNSECWTRRYDDKQHGDIDVMSRLFPSADFEAVAIIPVGHIADDCPHTEKKRKDIAEIVEEI